MKCLGMWGMALAAVLASPVEANDTIEAAARLFWSMPSRTHLLAVGSALEASRLSDTQRALDLDAAQSAPGQAVLTRARVPEFEAMKKHLRRGVLARSAGASLRPAPWETVVAERHNSLSVRGAATAIVLPEVRPSLFRTAGELHGPQLDAEGASEFFGVPYRLAVTSGPKWVPGDGNEHLFGAWDVGDTRSELLRPIQRHTVYADGAVVSRPARLRHEDIAPADADDPDCDAAFSHGDAGAKVARAALGRPVPRPRLFSFFTAGALSVTPARPIVTTVALSPSDTDGTPALVAATTYHFDLNADGVADLLVWEGTTHADEADLHRPAGRFADYRAFFANVAGQWHWLGDDAFVWGCGC